MDLNQLFMDIINDISLKPLENNEIINCTKVKVNKQLSNKS